MRRGNAIVLPENSMLQLFYNGKKRKRVCFIGNIVFFKSYFKKKSGKARHKKITEFRYYWRENVRAHPALPKAGSVRVLLHFPSGRGWGMGCYFKTEFYASPFLFEA